MVDDRNISVEERLAKAKKPGQDAMKMHPYYGGKVEVVPKACVRSFDDFAIWYSPGVAEPCKDIHANPDKVYMTPWRTFRCAAGSHRSVRWQAESLCTAAGDPC